MTKVKYEWCVIDEETDCSFFDSLTDVVEFLVSEGDILASGKLGLRLVKTRYVDGWPDDEPGEAYILDGKLEPVFQYNLRKDVKVPAKFVKQCEKHEKLLCNTTLPSWAAEG